MQTIVTQKYHLTSKLRIEPYLEFSQLMKGFEFHEVRQSENTFYFSWSNGERFLNAFLEFKFGVFYPYPNKGPVLTPVLDFRWFSDAVNRMDDPEHGRSIVRAAQRKLQSDFPGIDQHILSLDCPVMMTLLMGEKEGDKVNIGNYSKSPILEFNQG